MKFIEITRPHTDFAYLVSLSGSRQINFVFFVPFDPISFVFESRF